MGCRKLHIVVLEYRRVLIFVIVFLIFVQSLAHRHLYITYLFPVSSLDYFG